MKTYRQVMEEKIGRKLKREEIVHHIDGDSCNNDIKNLKIVSAKEHNSYKKRTKEEWDQLIKEAIEKNDDASAKDFYDNLDIIFSAKQRHLFFKKIYSEKMSKTEKEYYSRTVKKKIKLLAHEEIHKICKRIIYQDW
jgi:hypothetical protein